MKYLAFLLVFFVTPALADITVAGPDGKERVVTTRELACIAHSAMDAEFWVRNAVANDMLGRIVEREDEEGKKIRVYLPGAIDHKVAKWCPKMDAAKALLGADYKNRVQRDQ